MGSLPKVVGRSLKLIIGLSVIMLSPARIGTICKSCLILRGLEVFSMRALSQYGLVI